MSICMYVYSKMWRGSFSVVLMRDGWFISTVLHSVISESRLYTQKSWSMKEEQRKTKVIQSNPHCPPAWHTVQPSHPNYNIPLNLIDIFSTVVTRSVELKCMHIKKKKRLQFWIRKSIVLVHRISVRFRIMLC